MSNIVEDRVLESTTTAGTGALTLASAVTGFRRFNAVCAVGDTVPYFIEALDSLGQPTGDYEYGTGTYSAANTLTRTTVLGSSNAGAPVNFAAGAKNVGITLHKAQLQASIDARVPQLFNAGGLQNLAAAGYQKLPGGLIIQWGSLSNTAGATTAAAFPIAFPNACFSVVLTGLQATGNQQAYAVLNNFNLAGFNWNAFYAVGGAAPALSASAGQVQGRFIAIGY